MDDVEEKKKLGKLWKNCCLKVDDLWKNRKEKARTVDLCEKRTVENINYLLHF